MLQSVFCCVSVYARRPSDHSLWFNSHVHLALDHLIPLCLEWSTHALVCLPFADCRLQFPPMYDSGNFLYLIFCIFSYCKLLRKCAMKRLDSWPVQSRPQGSRAMRTSHKQQTTMYSSQTFTPTDFSCWPNNPYYIECHIRRNSRGVAPQGHLHEHLPE